MFKESILCIEVAFVSIKMSKLSALILTIVKANKIVITNIILNYGLILFFEESFQFFVGTYSIKSSFNSILWIKCCCCITLMLQKLKISINDGISKH